jgi:hypothetical protein
MSMSTRSISSIIIAIVVVVGAVLIGHHPRTATVPVVPGSVPDTSGWQTLANTDLGIQVQVPPHVWVYRSQEQPGCAQPLIFGTTSRSVAYLMPAFSTCDKDALSNQDAFAAEGTESKRVTVLPVANEAEIAGVIKGRIVDNPLFGDATHDCNIGGIQATVVRTVEPAPNGTLPVDIATGGSCSISPNLLTVRYSPQFKKVVLFESVFGYSENGDYVPNYDTWPYQGVDQSIYASVEVLK